MMAVQDMFILTKSEKEFLIYGPAHVELVDNEGDEIDIEAVKEALPQLLRRRAVSYKFHRDIIVGEILDERDVDGRTYRTGVVGNALYVLANIYGDNKMSLQAREEIEKGILKAYSISGQQIRHHPVIKNGMVVNRITKVDLFAVAICEQGVNPEATFRILSKADLLEKVVERRGSQYCVIHCHGPDAGKPIKCFPTKEQAEAMHRAIQANKHKDGSDLSEEEYEELAASIMKQHPEHWGEAWEGPKPSGRGRPDPAWWDACIRRAEVFADDPPAFCNALWHYGASAFRQAFGKVDIDGFLKSIEGDLLKDGGDEKLGPRSEEERAMAHFGISREDWNKLSEEEKKRYIERLPERGAGEIEKDGRPPKDWWDQCMATVHEGMPEYSDEQCAAVCGHIWFHQGVRKPVKSLADVDTKAILEDLKLKEERNVADENNGNGNAGGENKPPEVGERFSEILERLAELKALLEKLVNREHPEEEAPKEEIENKVAKSADLSPEKVKDYIDRLSDDQRKDFLAKIGITVAATPRPDGAQTEPIVTGAADESAIREKVEKALNEGGIGLAFSVLDDLVAKSRKR